MWESPIYKFKADFDGEKKEILIDVTGSAPNFSVPGKQLEGTFEVLLKGLDPSKTKILDFGGAKLRNTLYLLKKGYLVYACEFEDLFKRSKQAEELLTECKKFPNFKKLVFPNDFVNFEEKFDVVMLINVLDIMPVPIERLCVLALCREQMKEKGRLLWYTQHGAYSEKDAVALLFDGLVTGKGRDYNMFYRDFTRKEIHDMLQSTGFSYNKEFKFPMSGTNQAFVFNADGPILVDSTLGLISQLKRKTKSKLEEVERKSGTEEKKYTAEIPKKITKPEEVNILKQYLEELKKIKSGKKNAPYYHQLIFNILKDIFENKLKNPKKEDPIANGTQRVDITFKNDAEKSFFRRLSEGYKLTCPNIFFECKNYKEDLKNPEFFQLRCRLNKIRGQFGVIICRVIIKKENYEKAQDDAQKKDEYFIVLEDKDILHLGELKLNKKEEEIDEYLEDKFKRLT
jgi:hypothetical protein